MPISPLGFCSRPTSDDPRSEARCGGPLEVSSGPHRDPKRPDAQPVMKTVVRCVRCGHEHPDHPLVKECEAALKPAAPAHVIPPQHYASTLMDRMNLAEKEVAALKITATEQREIVETLGLRLAALEAAGQEEAGENTGRRAAPVDASGARRRPARHEG